MTALLLVCGLVVLVAFAKATPKMKQETLKPKRPAKGRGEGRKTEPAVWEVPDYTPKSRSAYLKVHELHDLWHHGRNVKVYVAARRNGKVGNLHRPKFAEMNLRVTGNHPFSPTSIHIGPCGVVAIFVDDDPGTVTSYQVTDYQTHPASLQAVRDEWEPRGIAVQVDDGSGGMICAGNLPATWRVTNNSSRSPANSTVDTGGVVAVMLAPPIKPPHRRRPPI